MIAIIPSEIEALRPRIVVIGVGGAGGNAVDGMIRAGVTGVDFIAANTDAQALGASLAERKIQLGRGATGGLGAGARAETGRAAAEEALREIELALGGAHMCFIAAGLGGGTGTGAAPVIARAARAKGLLTVGVVARPFAFEGARRARAAAEGIAALAPHVDALIDIPNQNLFRIARPETSFRAAFDMADAVLRQGVRSLTDLMVMPGLINLDFADIRTVMLGAGRAMIGTGEAEGEGRAAEAAGQAISNPLLDDAVRGARGLIVSISGGEDLKLMEVDEAVSHVKDLVDPEADIVWGSSFDPALEGRIRVSIVATGLDRPAAPAAASEPLEAPILLWEPEPEAPAPEPAPQPAAAMPSLFERMAAASAGRGVYSGASAARQAILTAASAAAPMASPAPTSVG